MGRAACRAATLTALLLGTLAPLSAAAPAGGSSGNASGTRAPADEVDPFIGTANGGNVYPGATLPFGMVAFSPETTAFDTARRLRTGAPGGYLWGQNQIRGFSLTHLSGTGCAGASGDIPIMPLTIPVTVSPVLPEAGLRYLRSYRRADQAASPGSFHMLLNNGVAVDLGATLRTGVARFTFPRTGPANLLFATSDSEVGSSEASIKIDPATRTVSGSVTSGNFCGYLSPARRQSYYTLHFVAVFDQPFVTGGTWRDAVVSPGATRASGGTGYGTDGYPVPGKGSGGWISFDPSRAPVVTARIGISYTDEAGAWRNLARETRTGTTIDDVQSAGRAAWNAALGRIAIRGGADSDRTVFRTALYHALLAPNLYSDTDGRYRGFDGKVHHLSPGQQAQYANYSGWDVYRSQLQLVTLLDPGRGSDIAQSLLNQADQNGGRWDRWTHLTGATGVMNGDPAPASLAAIRAFGGRRFDLARAYHSLLRAATVPTPQDLDRTGCPALCVGQRPGLDRWLELHYLPVGAPGWGSAADTLEFAAADFGLSELARAVGDRDSQRRLRLRSGWWRNLYNPAARPEGGFIQPRKADGSWATFDPYNEDDDGFVEASGVRYLWMVPFDPAGLFAAMGGRDAARRRLDDFFGAADAWTVTRAGPRHAELDNEPSLAAPWLYSFAGEPWKTQAVVRAAMRRIWTDAPEGISGNDDLGEMSSWYVWAALGLYPVYPGRAELVLGSPLFPEVRINRGRRSIVIHAPAAAPDAPYVRTLSVDGRPSRRAWLPAGFVRHGGTLAFGLAQSPDPQWGSAPADAPPSFGPDTDN